MASIYLLILCIGSAVSQHANVYLNGSLTPSNATKKLYLYEGQTLTLDTLVTYLVGNQSIRTKWLVLKCRIEDPKVGSLINWTDISFLPTTSINITTTVLAKRLGGSNVLYTIYDDINETCSRCQHVLAQLIVKRRRTVAEKIFRILLMVFIILITFVMGCELDPLIIWKYLKNPVSPLIGFLCQFLFMPLIAFSMAKLTNIDSAFGFGLLTIGCSPAGGSSNIWTLLLGGDLNLSMMMTFISSCSALFMMPLWLFALGRFFIDSRQITIPYKDIALNLLQTVIPMGVGMLFRWKFEKVAKILTKRMKIMGLIFIIYILTYGTYVNLYLFKLMNDYPFLVPIGACLPWIGFLFGYVFTVVTRRTRGQAIAISLETGIQNIGIAVLILRFSMPQPAGDMGAVMPIVVFFLTPIPLSIALIVLTIKKKYFVKQEVEEQKSSSNETDQKSILMDDTNE